jgi:branched-chain amino acid aminotransferase
MAIENFDELDVESIWADGELIPWDDAQIHFLSHNVQYGTSVLEGVRCYDTVEGPAIFRNEDHIARLQDSGGMLEMDIPFSREELMDASKTVVRENDLTACHVRPVAFYGYGTLGVYPADNPVRVHIAAWPRPPYLGEESLEAGVEVMISSVRRRHSSQTPTLLKVAGGYINSTLATQRAKAAGYDEAIFLNQSGDVAEGPGENIFVVENGSIYTPSLDSSILRGITRHTVMTLAEDLGYEVEEKRVTVGELLTADEVFFCGTSAEIAPVSKIDNVVIGEGKRGPVTEEIQEYYFEVVNGEHEEYHDWLDFI